MPELQSEQPLYTLPQKKSRIIIPKILTFIFLGIIFYLGVLLNLYLLNLETSIEKIVQLASLIVLAVIIITGIIFNIRKASQKYLFYRNRIAFQKDQVLLQEISSITPKKKFFDKLFKTYSLILTQKFTIKNIPQEIQLQDYLQKLIAYSKSQP